jgi:hypothetical protein
MAVVKCQSKYEHINALIQMYIDEILIDDKNKDEKNRVSAILNALGNDEVIDIKIKLMLLTRLIDNHGIINKQEFYDKLEEIKECSIEENKYNSKGNCDLDLIMLINIMRLDYLLYAINSNFTSTINNTKTTVIFNKITVDAVKNKEDALTNINIKKDQSEEKIININDNIITLYNNIPITIKDVEKTPFYISISYIYDISIGIKKLNDINMDEKIHIYTILYILIKTFYNANTDVKKLYKKIVIENSTRCAPRSFFDTEAKIEGGYNNKSGDIEYQICKCNFKQNIKKVSAKSAREAAKIVANKVLKGDKKSITFSLKRIIGKKEKCYDYNASIDKSGKILIKSQ